MVNVPFPTLAVFFLLLPATFVMGGGMKSTKIKIKDYIVYRATIAPLSAGGIAVNKPNVNGFVTLFKHPTGTTVGYTGIVSNLETNLVAKTCNATNGCGVHIHSGKSCFNATTQGGHYYDNITYPIDPWIDERYSSDSTGKANFHSILDMGKVNITGHAFIVHSKNGTRIGCGIIQRARQGKILKAKTSSLDKSGVDGTVLVRPVRSNIACFFGDATGLEPNLVSYMNQNKSYNGLDCNYANGCGVHIHNGTSCFNRTTQGGHYYNLTTYTPTSDPWLYTMYESTNRNGATNYIGCVDMGVSKYEGRPFVVHSNNGTRVACGLLKSSS